jgi:hypothetical protein
MTSLFAQLYLALATHLKQNMPAIKWIDLDLGQLDGYKERPALIFPCVLIDFTQAQYRQEGQQVQWTDFNIVVRLGFENWNATNADAPAFVQQDGLEYFELEHELVRVLNAFSADGAVQPLTRISAITERREDMYRVREITFTTATEDDSMMQPVNKAAADLVIEKLD